MTRVVYLSAPPLGEEMLAWLRKQPCEIVAFTTKDDNIGPIFKDYDLGLNFLGSLKVQSEDINKPPFGWVNFHPAPLPEYAGRNVAYHAIINGELFFGATCHYMTEEYDAGSIIEVVSYPVRESDTAGDLVRKSRQCCVDLFKKWVPELLKGKVPATPQDWSKRTYYHREQLDDRVHVQPWEERRIKALVCPPHLPHVVVGGKWYKLTPMEEWFFGPPKQPGLYWMFKQDWKSPIIVEAYQSEHSGTKGIRWVGSDEDDWDWGDARTAWYGPIVHPELPELLK